MAYKRMILEQSDESRNRDYIPNRGEAFVMGLQSGWKSAAKFFLFLAITLLVYIVIAC